MPAARRSTAILHFAYCILHFATCISPSAAQSVPDEFKIKRQEIFQFAQTPTVRVEGDRVEIAFATTAACDVTVAVENAGGRIVRHLASGVLGPNAPAPFHKDSLRQSVVWDGKDDRGRYVDEKDGLAIRVSLGLKARFERTLFWSPYKRPGDPKGIQQQPSLMAAAPEGVYVYEGFGPDHVRLFDHEGHYVQTVYPFAARELSAIQPLRWHTFAEDGYSVPLRWGLEQHTLLTSGELSFGTTWPNKPGGPAATTLLIHEDELLLVNQRVNRLAVGRGRADLREGPVTGIPLTVKDARPGQEFMRRFHVSPCSAAISPDGKWLYLTGFNYRAYFRSHALHGVARVAANGDGEPEVFAGLLKAGTAGAGSDDERFTMPSSVACDAAGRVYVTDWGNDRIQVFSPDGRLLKSIPVARPAQLRIHPRTGELYVFSWSVASGVRSNRDSFVKPTLTRLGPVDNPRRLASYPLDVAEGGGGMPPNTRVAEAEVDFHTDPPTIWLARNQPITWHDYPPNRMGILLLVEQDGHLVVKRDFLDEARRQVQRLYGPRHSRQRLYVNPANGWVYIGENAHPAGIHTKSITELVAIDPETGRVRLTTLPFDAEDIAFDFKGHAYLRTLDTVARYDPSNWREVPFDYGTEQQRHGYHPLKMTDVVSVITAVGQFNASSQMGGMAVSPRGHVAVTFWNPAAPPSRTDEKNISSAGVRRYTPPMFPGRQRVAEIHVWDQFGKLLYEDAFPGIGSMSGLSMDRDDNLYVLASACRVEDGRRWFNDVTCTLIKVRPGQARVLSTKGVIPLGEADRPARPPDLEKGDLGRAWVVGAEWMRGGVGMDAKMLASASRDCHCQATSRFDLDYFARSFVPEVDRCAVLVLDANGNLVLRIGRYGNVEDGVPLVADGGPANTCGIGGDEVGLFWANHVATHTDRRLFVADPGNARILSVLLDYHVTERVPLK